MGTSGKNLATHDGKTLLWHDFLAQMSDGNPSTWRPPAEIADYLQIWLDRFAFYDDIEHPEFIKIAHWKKNKKLKFEAGNLIKAILALKELEEIADNEKPPLYPEMRDAIIDIIKLYQLRLDIAQYKMLEKTQHVKRLTNWPAKDGTSLTLSVKEMKKIFHDWQSNLKTNRERYSRHVKNTPKLNDTYRLFKKHENLINYKKHLVRADQAAAVVGFANAINRITGAIAAFITAMIHALSAMAPILQAIPVISSISSAIPLIIRAADVWMQNKSPVKKAAATFCLILVAAGLVTSGFATLAAAIAALGLMVLGAITKNGIPWVKKIRDIYNKKNELAELAAIRNSLEEQKSLNVFSLREKQFFLRKLEDAWLAKNADKKSLSSFKMAILSAKSVDELKTNKPLTMLFGNDLDKFVLEQIKQRENDLISEISILKKEEFRRRLSVMNNALSVVGAICLCIPTPITIIIGASILLVSSVIGIVLEFNLVEKAAAAYRDWRNKQATQNTHDTTNQLRPERSLSPNLKKSRDNTNSPDATQTNSDVNDKTKSKKTSQISKTQSILFSATKEDKPAVEPKKQPAKTRPKMTDSH